MDEATPENVGACCALVTLPTIAGRYPDKEEEQALIRLAQTGDDRARNLLIECNLPFITSICRRYRRESRRWKLDELVNEGVFGYVHAIHKFEFERDCRLTTYAAPWIFQAINRFALNNGTTIRVPIHAQNWDSPKSKLDDETRACAEAAMRTPVSFKRQHRDDDGGAQSNEPAAPKEIEIEQFYPDIEAVILIVDQMGDERLQLIFYNRLEGKSLKAIGDSMGLTAERVRQLEADLFRHIISKM